MNKNHLNKLTIREVSGWVVGAVLFFSVVIYRIYPALPTKLTGWLLFIIITPFFVMLTVKLLPGKRSKHLKFRETVYVLTLIIIFFILLFINEKCSNCIGNYY